jgi:hypothetical protein
MELDRRKAMGGILGGALAGPEVAKRIASEINTQAAIGDRAEKIKDYATLAGKKWTGDADAEPKAIGRDWYVERIAKLKEKLLKIGEKEKLYDRGWGEVRKVELKTMRSISPVNRARMHVEWTEAQYEQRERDEILERIANYTAEMMGL